MNKQELLDELDVYLATRNQPTLRWAVGDINTYQLKGAIVRENDIAYFHDITFYVYKEGQGVDERAYYSGDPINAFWREKVMDYLNVTNNYAGRVFRARKPKAICRVLLTVAEGEKWVLITETAPDTYTMEDITGDIITDI